ncbi:hypothetical protein MTR67_001523 [Solanum verrucosum]|uniref:Uncharacterized protein n=1 Tax=Solanum verrucosum TaxID=315347 RepID=A0AAF0T8I1_SOLVR|nr:hypothetical protein MTR67_001523 [Solanum verrucosum]
MPFNNEEKSNNIHETERKTYNLRSKRCRKGKKLIDKGERQSTAISKTLKQKDCIKWTVDLSAKFKEATQRLGEGRCVPKQILEIMNVQGLTRMQVASYLQVHPSNNNFQQYIGEQNMHVRRYIVSTSSAGANEGSDLNEGENCDAYLNFHNMDDLYQNIGDSSSILPNGHGSEHYQVYSFDQVCAFIELFLLLNYSKYNVISNIRRW